MYRLCWCTAAAVAGKICTCHHQQRCHGWPVMLTLRRWTGFFACHPGSIALCSLPSSLRLLFATVLRWEHLFFPAPQVPAAWRALLLALQSQPPLLATSLQAYAVLLLDQPAASVAPPVAKHVETRGVCLFIYLFVYLCIVSSSFNGICYYIIYIYNIYACIDSIWLSIWVYISCWVRLVLN